MNWRIIRLSLFIAAAALLLAWVAVESVRQWRAGTVARIKGPAPVWGLVRVGGKHQIVDRGSIDPFVILRQQLRNKPNLDIYELEALVTIEPTSLELEPPDRVRASLGPTSDAYIADPMPSPDQ